MSDRRSFQQLLGSALVLLTALSTAAAYCRQGSEWIEFDGNCYHWSRTPVNWFRAELNCKQFGGHLVSIKSQNENNFLLRLTQCRNTFWIGMVNTDHSLKAQHRGYEWWDGTQHNYSMLYPQTNDYRDCVYFTANERWYNYYCQFTGWGHVCKAPATVQGSPAEEPAVEQQIVGSASSGQQRDKKVQQQEADAAWYTYDYTATAPAPDTTFKAETTLWPKPSTTQSPIRCQAGWLQLDNNCYFVASNATNYFNAQMSCQAMGASVTSILTMREHTLLTVALGCNSPTWIGLEKARPCFKQPNKDHCWVWMDRNPVNFFEWAPSQSLDTRDAECVILDGQWKVINCYLEYRYICKRPAYAQNTVD